MPGPLRFSAVGLAIALALSACGSSADDPLTGLGQGDSSSTDEVANLTEPSVAIDVSASNGATSVATATVDNVIAYDSPDGGETVAEFANPIETGGPLVFQVLDESTTGWLEVLLPVRPNGTTGWVQADDVELAQTPYRIEIDVSDHRLRVLQGDEEQIATDVGIGTGDTPTPIGSFYLFELLQPLEPNGPYGTYAFGLSGFSETLETFNGGNGVIGIHGTNEPSSLGTDVSHGCIRVANDVIDEMVGFLPLGTPVIISA